MLGRFRLPLLSSRSKLFLVGLALVLAVTLKPNRAEAINCTFRYCPLGTVCPESIVLNGFCCPPGTNLQCFYSFDFLRGCIRNVSGICV